jgi:hypothetical protein
MNRRGFMAGVAALLGFRAPAGLLTGAVAAPAPRSIRWAWGWDPAVAERVMSGAHRQHVDLTPYTQVRVIVDGTVVRDWSPAAE